MTSDPLGARRMANPNAVVSRVGRLDPSLDRPAAELLQADAGLSVELESGDRLRLDPGDRRSPGFARILDELSRERILVYVEADPTTSTVTRLFIPHVTRVLNIQPLDVGVLGVRLQASHGRHVLRRGAPDYEALEARLRDAWRTGATVVVTENDAHEILDVRDDPDAGAAGPVAGRPPSPGPPPGPPDGGGRVGRLSRFKWLWWPKEWLTCLSASKAQAVFDAMLGTSCDPLAVAAPCIPFPFEDDGCYGRAHEMRRLMVLMGLEPKKVWIQGNLYVSTKNNPTCCGVWWHWHVAPTLCVRGPGLLQTRDMVFDPSLFSTPVTTEEWKAAQGDPNAVLIPTKDWVFLLGSVIGSSTVADSDYALTKQALAKFRLQLQNRVIEFGPPPYAACE